jgi:hypothetical protein
MALHRARITFNLAFATFTSFVDLIFPELIPGTTFFIVKRVNTLVYNGVSSGAEICGEVSASTGESCVVDETSDDESERNDEQESKHIEHNECQSDAGENE